MADDPQLVDKLRQLTELHAAGALTDAEFDAAKAQYLPHKADPPRKPTRPRQRRRLAIVMMAAVLLLGVGAFIVIRHSINTQYKVAFTLDLDENGAHDRDIAVVNLDGSGLVRVTNNPALDEFAPKWSPDASQIAYVCGHGICRTDLDGHSHPLTQPEGSDWDGDPSWSPDGSRVAFTRYENSGSPSAAFVLMTIGADGRGLSKIPLSTWAQSPSWSPDGRRLLFAMSGQQYDIWEANADGSQPKELFAEPSYDQDPEFSPDGSHIVFDCGGQICVMTADGGDVHRIGNGSDPRWLPDGAHILAACSPAGQRRLCEMNADGTDTRTIYSPVQGEGYWPDPSPARLGT